MLGRTMPHYVSFLKWTEQGIKSVKDSPRRAEAARKLAEQMGGKIWIWYTMGKYDLVAISEFPDDAAANKYFLTVGSWGNVRTTSMKAWSEQDFAKLIGEMQ